MAGLCLTAGEALVEEFGEEVTDIIEPLAPLNAAPQMQALAAKAGFELVNVGTEGMDAFVLEMSCFPPR
jgi:hypothetical protein